MKETTQTTKPHKWYRVLKDGTVEECEAPPEGTIRRCKPEIKMPSRAWRDRNVCTRKD